MPLLLVGKADCAGAVAGFAFGTNTRLPPLIVAGLCLKLPAVNVFDKKLSSLFLTSTTDDRANTPPTFLGLADARTTKDGADHLKRALVKEGVTRD